MENKIQDPTEPQIPGAPPPGKEDKIDRRPITSRLNAQKSTGPRTPEGKLRARANAVTHGPLSKAIILDHESEAVFDRLFQDYIDEYQPQSPTELAYIETMTAAHWRKNRLLLVEKAAFQREIRLAEADSVPETLGERTGKGFVAFCEKSRAAELLNRYETRFNREFTRAATRLQEGRRLAIPANKNK